MPRTMQLAVEEILGGNYDRQRHPDLRPFILTANSLVEKVHSNDADGVMSSVDLERVEAFLAAHFYAHADQLYQSKGTDGASASFQGQTQMVLLSTQYGQTACMLDTTGWLASQSAQVASGKVGTARAIWLGRKPSEQTAYADRR